MGHRIELARSAACVALIGGAALAGQSWAADAGSQNARHDKSTKVGELVITAERRVENLQTTAISATVIDGKLLEAKGVNGLTALQFAAPGVEISDYGSANTFNIRGIGQSQVDIDLPSGVVIYRDGVPTLTGYFQNAPYYDMAGIEVLRGPQGTFVGKSASAGAVFIRTRDPELGHLGGEASAGVGNYGEIEGTGVVNLPVNDTLAIRFSTHIETRSSLFDRITSNPIPGGPAVTGVAGGPFTGDDDRRLISGRIGVLWEPTDHFRLVAKTDIDYLHFGSHATTGFDPATGLDLPLRDPVVNGPHIYVDKGVRSSLKMVYDFGHGYTVTSLSGFSTVNTRANWDVNGNDPYAFAFKSGGDFTNYSEEVDFASPAADRLSWVAGVFVQRYLNEIPGPNKDGFTFTINNTIFLDSLGLGALAPLVSPDAPVESSPWDKKEWNEAVFGQIDYKFNDKLDLQLGGRYGHYFFKQYTNWKLYPTVPFLNIPLEGSATDPLPNGHSQYLSENSFDWKVDLNYKFNDDQFVYALVSKGHTPGSINLGFNSVTADHTAYKQMSVINYEAGWKGSFFDGHLHTQLATYFETFKDYQAFFGIPAPAGTPPGLASIDSLFLARNAKTTSITYGLELGAQARFGELSLDGGLALFKSRLGSFGRVNNPFCVLYSFDAACTQINTASKYYGVYGTSATLIENGAETPFSPNVTANLGAAYTVHLATSGEPIDMTPRIDVSYHSDSYANLFHNPSTLLPGGFLVNMSVNFTRGPWWVSLWATNLLDRTYASAKQNVSADPGLPGTQDGAFFPGPHVTGIVYMAPPRLFGIRIGRTW